MNLRLPASIFVIFIACILAMNITGLSNPVFGIDSSVDATTNLFSINTDIEQNIKILTVSGTDKSGNGFSIDLILNKDLMGMHQMMMQHMTMMHGMINMSSMGPMGGISGMNMQSGSMGGMGGMMGTMNNTMMQSCPCMQMMKLMQSQYLIEGGMITLGSTAYPLDSGSARIVDDKLFLNAHAGAFKAGKIILYGKLGNDGGLKGILSLPETHTTTKIIAKGILTSAFQ